MAVKGNYLSAIAMFSAVGITCLSLEIDLKIIVAGVLLGGSYIDNVLDG